MYNMAETYGLIDLYITHIPKNLAEYYYKNLTFNASDEEVTSKVKTHKKGKRDAGFMSSEELVAWMTLKDFLHFARNRSTFFYARSADVPMSVGSPAGSVANVLDEELEMVVDVARPVGSPWRVIAPSLDVYSKGKRVAFPNSAGSLSFKKRKHVVLDEGLSSPKFVPDFALSDEACKTLFGSLASTEDPGDSDPFLPGIKEARSFRDALYNLSYHDVQRRLNCSTLPDLTNFHDVAAVLFVMSNNLLNCEAQALFVEVFWLRYEVEALKDKMNLANQERSLFGKVMLVGRSQALREVTSSGIGLEFEDIKDFDPNAKENYDRAIESFYQVKFPYVDLLVHYVGQSMGKLMTLKPPIIPFENASTVGPFASLFL
nr:pentatricopeptide repeat-containing protein [Tanacetum cinerariifolium]